jgi:predicted nucleic acid-binding protein
VTFIDTSAWVEFLRDSGSGVCAMVEELLAGEIVICDVVSMELLAGARDERHLADLRGLLARATVSPITAVDYDEAAALYRVCRRGGETVRRINDCLIAAVAIREHAPMLHADADFTVLARHTSLSIHPASLT